MHLDEEVPEELESADRKQAAQRCTWISVVVNLFLTLGQVIVGLLAHSSGLIADGIHSLSDLAADFVVLIATRHSNKAPDRDHHYGHYRYETAASLVLGVMLLAVGGGMLWSATMKLANSGSIPAVQSTALWVALMSLVIKEGLFRYMLAVAQRLRSSMLVANAWHARSDALSSVVVAIGIGGSLLGVPVLDPIAALIVGTMVFRMGWTFSWDALHDLMDRSVSEAEEVKIRECLTATPGVIGVHDLRTRKTGDMFVVDVHLEIDGKLSVCEGHDIAVEARRRVMASLPVMNLMTHVDPAETK